jgi:hypothetical protein
MPESKTIVHRERAGARQLARDVQQREEVALVVGGAAGVEAAVADLGLERRRRPRLERTRSLNVVVAVDEHGRRVRVGRAQLADREGVARCGDDRRLASRAGDALDDPRRGALEVGRTPAARRDRRDPQPIQQVLEQRTGHDRASWHARAPQSASRTAMSAARTGADGHRPS